MSRENRAWGRVPQNYVTLMYDGVTWRPVFGSASGRALAEQKRDRLRALGYPAVVIPLQSYARAVAGSRLLESLENLAACGD